MNKIFLLICLILLTACSTQPVVKVNYYFLEQPGQAQPVAGQSPAKAHVAVQYPRLAGYLNQLNIAMQRDDHQLYYSTQHAWAEKLDIGMHTALLADLNAGSDQYSFVSERAPTADLSTIQVIIDVTHFIPTKDGEVIFSGHYWLLDIKQNNKQTEVLQAQDFSYRASLDQDGFPHAVSKLRELIQHLSTDIKSSVVDSNLL